jgi:hypothetical protein
MCGLMLDTVAEGKLNHNDLYVLTSDFQREVISMKIINIIDAVRETTNYGRYHLKRSCTFRADINSCLNAIYMAIATLLHERPMISMKRGTAPLHQLLVCVV